jgi:hypothetical protein
MPEIIVNFIAVIVAAVAQMIIGAIWYAPPVFGKMWMKLTGISQKDIDEGKKQMPKTYAFAFVGALIMGYILAILLNLTGAITIMDGLQIGFLVWLGFIATSSLSLVLFEGRKQELYLLNSGYNLVGILVMSAILALWV